MQRKAVLYDKAGDQHYDYISAWIKSTRGSDPDASLYYLAAMLEGGEDPRFIARRMIILASEDIGNADPQALQVAVAAAHAVEHVGLPEAQFALAQAAIYLSLAPKSDAAKRAIGAARGHIREHGAKPPPARAAVGGLPGGAQARPRQGLRLPARPPGPRQRPGAPARGPRGPALLRPATRGSRRPPSGWRRSARPAAASDVAHTGAPRGCRWRSLDERCPPPSPAPTRCPAARRCGCAWRAGATLPPCASCWPAAGSRPPRSRWRRLLAFDPARAAVICACAPVDGRETVVGLGAIDLRPARRSTRSWSTRRAPTGLGELSARCCTAGAEGHAARVA